MSIKSAVKGLCDSIGVNELLVRLQRSDLLVLCYHGVLAERRPDRWSYENWVSADEFRSQLRWLKRFLQPLSLADLANWHSGRSAGGKAPVLITFDDGYRNNLTVAAPILREEGVPAAFFLATGYIGTPRTLWNDEVRIRVLNWPESAIRLPSGETAAVSSDATARRSLANQVTRATKKLTGEPCAAYMEYLRSTTASLNVMDDPEARAFMNWDEARKLASLGFDLGSHTVEHPILSRITRVRMADELSRSKATMERELNRPCTAIAYPNGTAEDVNEELFEEVKAAGYQWAFLTTPVWQKPGGDVLRIPRVVFPGHTDMSTFKFYASGLHGRLSGAA
jgi:peptidoglycan/xylan/chitin deacetylase (PgdA/CDA1 family)